MNLVALNWAVLEFTGSALYLGLINACRMVPAFLLSVPAGVLADRSDWTDEDRRIADIMSSYAVNFATSEDPNGKVLPLWAASDPGSPTRWKSVTISAPSQWRMRPD
jgi:hypothetical protein